MSLRLLLADDHTLMRQGLRHILESNSEFDIVAEASSGIEAVEAAREHKPDVAVVDVRLPPTFTDEGLRAAIEARRRHPGFPVLILSQYVEQLYARELLADGTGGIGYLLKDRVFDSAQFVDAVRRVAGGGTAMDPEVIARLLARNTGNVSIGALSPREREVLALMAEGASNAGIGRRIFITEGTVEKHVRSILTKLDLPESDTGHRRVLAVLRFLDAR